MSGARETPVAIPENYILSGQEWRALFDFGNGKTIARPMRRRLVEKGLLAADPRGGWYMPFSTRYFMTKQAPRSKWSPPASEAEAQARSTRTGIRQMGLVWHGPSVSHAGR